LPGAVVAVRFLTRDEAMCLLQATQAHAGMSINPAYVDNVRAVVQIGSGPAPSQTTALVPNGLTVAIGARVEVVGGYVDPFLPCHYIPDLIARVL